MMHCGTAGRISLWTYQWGYPPWPFPQLRIALPLWIINSTLLTSNQKHITYNWFLNLWMWWNNQIKMSLSISKKLQRYIYNCNFYGIVVVVYNRSSSKPNNWSESKQQCSFSQIRKLKDTRAWHNTPRQAILFRCRARGIPNSRALLYTLTSYYETPEKTQSSNRRVLSVSSHNTKRVCFVLYLVAGWWPLSLSVIVVCKLTSYKPLRRWRWYL